MVCVMLFKYILIKVNTRRMVKQDLVVFIDMNKLPHFSYNNRFIIHIIRLMRHY